jgi:DNA-binding CsgD family transcriptional regulator
VHSAQAPPGLIVVDASLSVVATNAEGLQILTFPARPENIHHQNSWLTNRICSDLVDKQSPLRLAGEFQSAKRTYFCRSFPLELAGKQKRGNHKNGSDHSHGLLVVVLERKSNEAIMIADISARFGLTTRERETVQFLLEGFTSKEIASRMNISPNTVKAFIRLVMVKTGVSTRSGIIGRIVGLTVGLNPAVETPLRGATNVVRHAD